MWSPRVDSNPTGVEFHILGPRTHEKPRTEPLQAVHGQRQPCHIAASRLRPGSDSPLGSSTFDLVPVRVRSYLHLVLRPPGRVASADQLRPVDFISHGCVSQSRVTHILALSIVAILAQGTS